MLNVWSFGGAFTDKVADTWSFALQDIRMYVVIVCFFWRGGGRELM